MSSTFVLSRDAENVAECFSAHYTNIFLIYLYSEARKYVEKEANIHSLTEGYKTALAAYNNAMSKDDFVKQTLHGVYNQFVKIDKTIRIRECTSKILKAFYPEDGYKGVIKQEKLIELAISKIVHDVSKQIIYTVPVKHAKAIIDANKDIQTQLSMQDEFTQIILELMERNHIEYLNKKKSQYHHPSTDHVMFEKAKDELSKLNSEKSELTAKYNALVKQLNDLQLMNNDLREKVGNQQGKIKELEQQISRSNNSVGGGNISANNPMSSIPAMITPYVQPATKFNSVSGPQINPVVVTTPQEKVRRDYSHLINSDSDNESEDDRDNHDDRHDNRHDDHQTKQKKAGKSRVIEDDESEISLDMFSK